jgi:hypothetical protein
MDILDKMHDPNRKRKRCPLCGEILTHIECVKYKCNNNNCHLDIIEF